MTGHKTDAVFRRRTRSSLLAIGLCCLSLAVGPSSGLSKVEGDKIILGAAVSLSGKYAGSGLHTKNGYDLAVETINKAGVTRLPTAGSA